MSAWPDGALIVECGDRAFEPVVGEAYWFSNARYGDFRGVLTSQEQTHLFAHPRERYQHTQPLRLRRSETTIYYQPPTRT